MDLQQAFQAWVNLMPQEIVIPKHTRVVRAGYRLADGPVFAQGGIFPIKAHWDGKCCVGDHHKLELGSHRPISKPDNEVCARERAWRQYVRIRDAG